MGYCVELLESNFTMRKENMPSALEALKRISEEDFDWITAEKENVLKSNTLVGAMNALDWKLEIDRNGNVCAINFEGDKSHNDGVIMSAIAPFVEKDSFIMMLGENCAVWAWQFNGITCKEEFYP